MGADCKSVGLCLRRFESYICHTWNPGEDFFRWGFHVKRDMNGSLTTQFGSRRSECVTS